MGVHIFDRLLEEKSKLPQTLADSYVDCCSDRRIHDVSDCLKFSALGTAMYAILFVLLISSVMSLVSKKAAYITAIDLFIL
jgi:hypothetical protein